MFRYNLNKKTGLEVYSMPRNLNHIWTEGEIVIRIRFNRINVVINCTENCGGCIAYRRKWLSIVESEIYERDK